MVAKRQVAWEREPSPSSLPHYHLHYLLVLMAVRSKVLEAPTVPESLRELHWQCKLEVQKRAQISFYFFLVQIRVATNVGFTHRSSTWSLVSGSGSEDLDRVIPCPRARLDGDEQLVVVGGLEQD